MDETANSLSSILLCLSDWVSQASVCLTRRIGLIGLDVVFFFHTLPIFFFATKYARRRTYSMFSPTDYTGSNRCSQSRGKLFFCIDRGELSEYTTIEENSESRVFL